MLKVATTALAAVAFLLLGNTDTIRAQTAQQVDSPFFSVLGGAWNVGHGFYGSAKASAAINLSRHVFVELGGSVLWRPRTWCTAAVNCEDVNMIKHKAVAIGAFREFTDTASTARPFLGVSLEFGVGELEGTLANAHLGVRQRFAGDLGLRLGAVGKIGEGGTAYELLAGLYLNL